MKISTWSPYLLSVLRIVTALLFVEHGSSKLLGFPPPAMPAQLFSQEGFFRIPSIEGLSGVLELVGGMLLVIGLFTRVTAFILSGEMAVAYFMVHASHNFFPLVNKGELAVLYCFVFLYLFAAGGGPWSVDALRRRA